MSNKALDHKCPSCGAPIFFKPKENKWVCDYCKSGFSLKELQKHNNASSEKNNEQTTETKKTKSNDTYVSYRCKNCNAEIVADEHTAATFCVYCGNTAILKEKLSGEFAPTKIIPFKKEKNIAVDAFKKLSKGRPLMPKSFNSEENIQKITGVYIPFWLYDMQTEGKLEGMGTKITSWRVGDTVFTKTDVYKLIREATMEFTRVPVDGSTNFANDVMNSIEPYNYEEMIDYNHAYLSGFLAEKYNVNSEESRKEPTDRAVKTACTLMENDMVGYGSIRINGDTVHANIKKTEYVLLPVWMVNVKYKDKFYLFAMNGQTGEFVGNIPIDKKKMFIYSIIIFIGVFLLIIAISYLYFIYGGNL